jgi:hypothetical protein
MASGTQVFFLYPINDMDSVWPSTPFRGVCLVYAGNESEARQLAASAYGDAGSPWGDAKHTSCKPAALWGDPPPHGYRAVYFLPEDRGKI